MSVKLTSAFLQKRLDKAVEQSIYSTRNGWFIRAIEAMTQLGLQMTSDVLTELEAVIELVNRLDWYRIHRLYKVVSVHDLTQQAAKIDFLAAIFAAGLKEYELRYKEKLDEL